MVIPFLYNIKHIDTDKIKTLTDPFFIRAVQSPSNALDITNNMPFLSTHKNQYVTVKFQYKNP